MSKIDDRYITALESFTGALDEIVRTLKEQQDTGKADVVNEMLTNINGGLQQVVADLKKVNDGIIDLKKDNQEILAKLETIKQQKQPTGPIEQIEDPKNKNKIVDGIKMVMLIAGGVLAEIGRAHV